MLSEDLYDTDFYVWTQTQAEALRAAAKAGGRSNAIDWERVAEEVEDLGNSQYFACRSLLAQIIAHLLKLAWTRRREPKAGWRTEIEVFRLELHARMTSSIRRRLEGEIERVHELALKMATTTFLTHEPKAPRDDSLRWSLEQILGERDDPIG